MFNKQSFIQVTVLQDSATPDAPPHKATIALSHICTVSEFTGSSPASTSAAGARIILREPISYSEPWFERTDGIAIRPIQREMLVAEEYRIVQWLIEAAERDQRIVSREDYEQYFRDSVRLQRDMPAPTRFKLPSASEQEPESKQTKASRD